MRGRFALLTALSMILAGRAPGPAYAQTLPPAPPNAIAAETATQPADRAISVRPTEFDLQGDLYRLVKRFDFHEQDLGNYDRLPMYWERLDGPGLPAFNQGEFDFNVGYAPPGSDRPGPPSFRLDVRTGNIAYEYRRLDLSVVPNTDYYVVGWVRTEGLVHSRAFIVAYLVDRFGVRIDGSARVSEILNSDTDDESWRQISLAIDGDHPEADALALQVWILHDYVWDDPEPRQVDPIIRRDTAGTAWFDELAVYRLPRARLSLSEPSGLVQAGAAAEFTIEVNNATPFTLSADLEIDTVDGENVRTLKVALPTIGEPHGDKHTANAATAEPVDVRLVAYSEQIASVKAQAPDLPPGVYNATLRLLGGPARVLARSTRFAVLAPLPIMPQRTPDLGLDIGPWRTGGNRGLVDLIKHSGFGAAKVGVPMVGAIEDAELRSLYRDLSATLRELTSRRIETTGVMLIPDPPTGAKRFIPTLSVVPDEDRWNRLCNPVLSEIAATVPNWQVGDESLELADGRTWNAAFVDQVRSRMERFLSIPELVIPEPVTAFPSNVDGVRSIPIPATLPTIDLAGQLEFLLAPPPPRYWLHLEQDNAEDLDYEHWLTQFVQRFVVLKALGPERLYVDAPFELRNSGGVPAWQPTPVFPVLRTLACTLGGMRAIAAAHPADDVVMVIFTRGDESCMAIWTWRDGPLDEPLELYLGDEPQGLDIYGNAVALEQVDRRTRVAVTPMPLFIRSLDTPLALLHAGFELEPRFIEIPAAQPAPTLQFENPFDAPMAGVVELTPPQDWVLTPTRQPFNLAPGATFSAPLAFRLAPNQLAETRDTHVELRIDHPRPARLVFDVPIEVGLTDIEVETLMTWEGDDLIVEHSVRNLSGEVVSFETFCQPAQMRRVEGVLMDISPGSAAIQPYRIPDARARLTDTSVWMGVREIRGSRTLNQLVPVP